MASKQTAVKKTTPAVHNPPGFAQALLRELAIPPTKAKLAFLNLWLANEGNNSGGTNGRNNPLNLQGASPHPWNFNTPQEGAKATAQVLRQSNFSGILRALRDPRATPASIAYAVENSPWAASHYGATRTTRGYVGGHLTSAFTKVNPTVDSSGIDTSQWGGTPPKRTLPVTGGVRIVEGAKPDPGIIPGAINSVEDAITGPLGKIGKDILYGMAIAGGGALCLTGLILIGADIGLEKFGKTRPAQIGGRVSDAISPTARAERRESSAMAELEAEETRRRASARTTREEEKAKQETIRTSIARSKLKQQRSRSKPIGGKIPY